jgi:tetratricopeptide (TPR) repeat protein
LSEALQGDLIRAQLERILTSSQLEASPSLCRLLRFVVEETLCGRGGSLKEYSLGTQVFDRGEAFDPRMDPIVRVQARNLRARLAQYYTGPGVSDPILIDLPKRTYVPVFQARTAEAPAVETAEEPAEGAPLEPTAVPALVTEPIAPVASHSAPFTTRRAIPGIALAAFLLALSVPLWLSHKQQTGSNTIRVDTQAQDLYIRGRYLLDRQTEQSIRSGIAAFQQAVARDPDFAPAYAGLADGYNVLAQYGYIPPSDGMEPARRAAEHALDLDPGLAEGHVSLAAVIEAYDWNWKGAEREYRRALELNPALPSAHLWYGMFLRDQGRLHEALPELRRAAQLDPYSAMTNINLAYGLMMEGNHATALEQASRAAEVAPELVTAHVIQANTRRALSQTAEADAALARAEQFCAGNPHGLAMVARAYARSGKRGESQRLFGELEQLAQRRYVSPFDLGTVSLALEDEERALALLKEAFRQRSSGLIFLRHASFSRMQRSREFNSLIEKMNFAG